LFAAREGGDLVFTYMEDTDLDRSKREYEDEIITSLHWLGLTWTEGLLIIGGDHAPYRKTERRKSIRIMPGNYWTGIWLIPVFCTEEELEAEAGTAGQWREMPRLHGALPSTY
jgi:nondiscriminating glutamyl-tRNA synthetase